jgi:hypothetical protein
MVAMRIVELLSGCGGVVTVALHPLYDSMNDTGSDPRAA